MNAAMHRRTFTAGAMVLAAAPLVARAQQPPRRVPRIAYLTATAPGDFRSQAILQGLHELGYQEGESLLIDYYRPTAPNDWPRLARQAAASRPDVIVAIGDSAVLAAKAESSTIPIVFGSINDPVASGLVASLARPGGNVTGPATMQSDLAGKRLQFLKEIVPGLAHVTVLYGADATTVTPLGVASSNLPSLLETKTVAGTLGLAVDVAEAGKREDLRSLVVAAAANGAQAVYAIGSILLIDNAAILADALLQNRLPSVHDQRAYVQAGCLLSYGPDLYASYKRAAYYIDRILKGAKPADLPVEQPREFDFAINKKTADALELKIPEPLLVFATEVIE